HILGICGTFMGGLAMLARSLGHEVTGSDANVYPPMSTLLEKQGIDLIQGYDASQLDPQPDLVIIGNAMTRGNPCVEAVLEKNIPFMSGPQWLHDFVLRDRWVCLLYTSPSPRDMRKKKKLSLINIEMSVEST
ncbi:Mur ligase domain-containing protein, partial [Staphylococcus aureus]|nr:Mur ligase domain-containing protein [Staphylococcus aureus]